jgi:hypothetical protein
MSVPDVSLAILENAHSANEWNSYNWMNGRQGRSLAAMRKLAEGWQWLFGKERSAAPISVGLPQSLSVRNAIDRSG